MSEASHRVETHKPSRMFARGSESQAHGVAVAAADTLQEVPLQITLQPLLLLLCITMGRTASVSAEISVCRKKALDAVASHVVSCPRMSASSASHMEGRH